MTDEYTPDSDAVRSAWRYAMTGETTPGPDTDAAFDRYETAQKARYVSAGYIAAQEASQHSLEAALRKVQGLTLRTAARNVARLPSTDAASAHLLAEASRVEKAPEPEGEK